MSTPKHRSGSRSGAPVDGGYFPAGKSVLRKVHEERVVGALYGQRSLLMQATHPLAFTGLIDSTTGLDAPFRRLARTAQSMETVYFGTRAEADRVTARVRRMHAHVEGTIDRDAGNFAAGSHFSANDPQLALWILACLADSSLSVYRTFLGSLARPQLKQFWLEYRQVGQLFGLAPDAMPATYEDFRHYMHLMLGSSELFVTDEARELGRHVAFQVPVPLYQLPALPAINFAVIGLLPSRVRRMYRLPWSPVHSAAFQSIALSARISRPWVPDLVSCGPSAANYNEVARTEARRTEKSKGIRFSIRIGNCLNEEEVH